MWFHFEGHLAFPRVGVMPYGYTRGKKFLHPLKCYIFRPFGSLGLSHAQSSNTTTTKPLRPCALAGLPKFWRKTLVVRLDVGAVTSLPL